MTPAQTQLQQAARQIGRTFGLGVTAWIKNGNEGVTGTIFRESKPTFQSAAPGLPPIGVQRWLFVLELGAVSVGDVLTGGGYTYRVSAPDVEIIGTWEVQPQ